MWVSDTVKENFENRKQLMLKKIIETDIVFLSIGVFGSYARNEYKATSDIDMCIIVPELPSREIKGYLYEEADMLHMDLIFVTEEYFKTDMSRFTCNLRRDFKEIKI